MSIDIGAIVERAKLAAAEPRRDGTSAAGEREQLKRIAAEFESMLLVQMLKDMRKAGSWDETEEQDTLGAETLFETLDVELATHLARVKGMGLKEELLTAFDRMQPAGRDGRRAIEGSMPPTTESTAVPAALPVPAARTFMVREPDGPVASPAPAARTFMVREPEATVGEPDAFVKPVSGAVTSDFGWRRDPFTSRMTFHQGVDMRAAYGQEVQAAGAGRVVFSGEQGGYGTSVVIEHADGTRTRYAHLSAALVAKGDAVDAGAPVGRAGRSGRATGTHLHFEVIGQDGRRLPPEQWARLGTGTHAD